MMFKLVKSFCMGSMGYFGIKPCMEWLYIDTISATPQTSLTHFSFSSSTFSPMEEDQKELQLLPTPLTAASSSKPAPWPSPSTLKFRPTDPFEGPSLDLQLSISLRPIRPPSDCLLVKPICDYIDVKPEKGCVEALKLQAAEQIRLAAMEKEYAERVRELTRREMELAQTEFARARLMWERAREEVEKAEKMKERATRQIDSACMEITCQSCRQKFRP